MTNIDKYPTDSFCWLELATTDQDAAKKFYTNLFGWAPADMPMGPGEVYTMFKLGDRDAGTAAYTLRNEQKGMPPNWGFTSPWRMRMCPRSVPPNSAARSASRRSMSSTSAGCRWCRILPERTFCLWQAKQKPNAVTGVEGTLCWADLSTPDPEVGGQILFRPLWMEAGEIGARFASGYLHIKNGEQFIGGVPPNKHRPPGPAHWLPYIQVSNCDAIAAKAKQSGANFHLEPMTMEGVGRFAVIADPQGAVFAIFQALPRK